jgi:hypothetical protein
MQCAFGKKRNCRVAVRMVQFTISCGARELGPGVARAEKRRDELCRNKEIVITNKSVLL